MNHYLHADYNTPGCPATPAHADNDQETGPFIGAACDWKTTDGSLPPLSSCIWSSPCRCPAPLAMAPCYGVVGCLLYDADPVNSCTPSMTEWCGSDFVPDGINYGHGAAGVYYPAYYADQGDLSPQLDTNGDGYFEGACLNMDATAQVFVFDTIGLDANGMPHAHPALTGEIWQDD